MYWHLLRHPRFIVSAALVAVEAGHAMGLPGFNSRVVTLAVNLLWIWG